MMKGQYLLIQFVVFFVIGLSIFTLIGNLFRFQTTIYREEIVSGLRENIALYFNSLISMQNSCRGCDNITYEVVLRNRTVGYFVQVALSEDTEEGVFVVTLPGEEYYLSGLQNLGKTFELSGIVHSNKPIKITVDKVQNSIEVWQ